MRINFIKSAVLSVSALTLSIALFAQTSKPSVKMERVTFKNGAVDMVGNIYYPAAMDKDVKYPAIVCSNAAGAVKEQAAGLYASRLAEKGFIAIAFDATHQGESSGEPRYLEDPYRRVEDIRCVVDFLTTLPNVDRERIGAMGICAGGGYSVNAAMTERRIKAVAGVSATDAGAAIREGWDGKAPIAEQIKLLEAIAAERTAEANGAEPVYGTYVPEVVEEGMAVTMREANDYYRTSRGGHPRSENKVLMRSLDKTMSFSAYHLIDKLLTQPLLMVVGSKSDAFYLSEIAINQATCDKELFVIEGATHVDMYDKEPYVSEAVEKLSQFFSQKM